MTPTKFNEIVKARAHERVQARILAFKEATMKAAQTLLVHVGGYNAVGDVKWPPNVCAVLKILASSNNTREWPAKLWDDERAEVSRELLATMDEMQKALAAPPASDDDCQPATDDSKEQT